MSDNRNITYIDDDGTIVYRASAVGGCITQLVASRLGYEPIAHSEETLLLFEKGNLAEPRINTWLEENGYELADQQLETELSIVPGIVIRGHIDATGIKRSTNGDVDRTPQRILIEDKFMGKTSYAKWTSSGVDSFPRYEYQTSIYCHSLGLQHYRVAIETDAAGDDSLLYDISAERTPKYSIGQLRLRILAVEKAVKAVELPACDNTSFPCPYYYLHDKDDAKSTQSLSPVNHNDGKLSRLIEVALYAAAEIKIHQNRYDLQRAEILKLMKERNVDRVRGTTGTATISSSTRTDYKKAVEDNNIDVSGYKSVGKAYITLTAPKRTATDGAAATDTSTSISTDS